MSGIPRVIVMDSFSLLKQYYCQAPKVLLDLYTIDDLLDSILIRLGGFETACIYTDEFIEHMLKELNVNPDMACIIDDVITRLSAGLHETLYRLGLYNSENQMCYGYAGRICDHDILLAQYDYD